MLVYILKTFKLKMILVKQFRHCHQVYYLLLLMLLDVLHFVGLFPLMVSVMGNAQLMVVKYAKPLIKAMQILVDGVDLPLKYLQTV
jgi:hypothetical protein